MLKKLILLSAILFWPIIGSAQIEFPDSTYESLDYGLYWFDYSDAQKATPGQSNPYYDKDKKTIIYIHGWQFGSVQQKQRETLDLSSKGGPQQDLAHYWLDRGWNVGVLYWNQFADESNVEDAEAKIYVTNGPQGIRWKDSFGNYHNGPNKPVSEFLTDSVAMNMADFQGAEFRIAGHSLGNQVALNVSKRLLDKYLSGSLSLDVVPKRISLLDPYYSNNAKWYLGFKWPGQLAREKAEFLMQNDIVIESYRSSTVSIGSLGDENKPLMEQVAFSELKPWNFNFLQLIEKHIAAVSWYFGSIDVVPPTLTNNSTTVPSAGVSDNRIQQLMDANWSAEQDLGAFSQTISDDTFKTKSR
jgi:hypothetical protein